ncbi:hypothetical protein EII29_02535 [Leptotrichia sp. OH3620_COT-345]|uniref:hypothetical protein n=1 Tax=Leptotrichia sp. OH3620_COT-345 TaxID=2491048 RepID=UPI000F653FE5|nr:hypothetical protein [Leptotrichia sp. OH3620_COT-345]RRD40375.1 hypothetical protein EII29_02535 [Leptotrichia sp. OH3620_COT-345]
MIILIIFCTIGILEFLLLYKMKDIKKWKTDNDYRKFFITFSVLINTYLGLYLYLLYSKNINYMLNICGLFFISLKILEHEKLKFKDERIIEVIKRYSIVICVCYFLIDLTIKRFI